MRRTIAKVRTTCAAAALGLLFPWTAPAQAAEPVLVDKVVALVNNRVILASDVESELRLAALEPEGRGGAALNPQGALDNLVSRALIEQQIRQEEAQAAEPTAEEVRQRMAELRKDLPACVRANCATDAGWTEFLDAHGLTEARVQRYLRGRIEILTYIANRFRQGIRIAPEEIEAYYRDTLLPQYPKGEPAPPLESVSDRIAEILLQERVNGLFSAWLDNLRKQGDVEVLDAELQTEPTGASR